jgi:hypothetical protein
MTNPFHSLYQRWRFTRRQERFRLEQGRLTAAEAAQQFGDGGVIPLCQTRPAKAEPMTLRMKSQPYDGHLLLVAPPGSQFVAQSIHGLLSWPDAALVVDPGGMLHANTAALRQRFAGPVYKLPGHQLDLGAYYRFWNETQAKKLHHYLMSPYPPEDGWRIERSLSLLVAVGNYAYAHKLNLAQLLLDVAACDLLRVLQGLETVPYAQLYVRQFTKGQAPLAAIRDEEAVDAFDEFAHRMRHYQEYYHMFAAEPVESVIPLQWAQTKATLYLTFDALQRQEMGGLVTAIVAGLIRHHFSHGRRHNLLVIMDQATASQIPGFTTMLNMAANYGVTIVLIADSWQGLKALLGHKQSDHLRLYFRCQLWYPPRDGETAVQMARLLGNQLDKETLEEIPAVSPTEIEGWSADQVLAVWARGRTYRFIGQSLTLPENMRFFPAPPLPPVPAPAPRYYLEWAPSLPAFTQAAPPNVLTAAAEPKKLPPPVTIIESKPKQKQPQSAKRKGWK